MVTQDVVFVLPVLVTPATSVPVVIEVNLGCVRLDDGPQSPKEMAGVIAEDEDVSGYEEKQFAKHTRTRCEEYR